jgi:hypothetical protein
MAKGGPTVDGRRLLRRLRFKVHSSKFMVELVVMSVKFVMWFPVIFAAAGAVTPRENVTGRLR